MRALMAGLAAAAIAGGTARSAAPEAMDLKAPSFGLRCHDASELGKLKFKGRPPVKAGVWVTSVFAYGPAAAAGFGRLDIINQVNSKRVKDVGEFFAAVAALKPDRDVHLGGFKASVLGSGTIVWRSKSFKATPRSLRDVLFEGMRTKTDEIEKVTFVEHKDSPEHVNDRTEIEASFTVKGDVVGPLVVHSYYLADHWLFVERVTIKAGGKTFTIAPDRLTDVKRDNSAGRVWEWFSTDSGPLEEMIEAMMKEPSVTARYEGQNYIKDREIDSEELLRLYCVMLARRSMTK